MLLKHDCSIELEPARHRFETVVSPPVAFKLGMGPLIKERLSYDEDVRKDPTSGRKANFKQGWTRAVEGQEYEGVLEQLTWNNLGWRLGRIFGDTPEYLRDEMYEWCKEQRNATEES